MGRACDETGGRSQRTDTSSGLSLPISEVQLGYDAAGNVSGVTTTLAAVGGTPGGSETQAFCYDDLDRLTWAGTSGTGPCGRVGSEGITGAGYTASYAYDPFDRITSASVLNGSGAALPNAAQGTYSYSASGHLHAVSSVGTGGTGYSAAYDAAGELTCRAVGASTCTNATPTGQTLGYDALRRLISWQNATTSPTATGAYAYDGSGSRVWQQDTSTSGGVTTTTTITYILGFAEITSVQIGQAAPSTTATRFYSLPGGVSALRDAAGLSYVASDHLGTPIATLNLDTGAVLGEQLRAPYGQPRYAASASVNGGMRTTHGFTGQREDTATGLDYYGFRYLDPVAGQFTSADTVLPGDGYTPWGLSRYGYVQGNPETKTDPDGHCWPLCTMIIGAVVGAVVGAGISMATQAVSGKPIDWGQVGKEAAVGAVSGAITGLAGPGAGMIAHTVLGAAAGAAGQVVANAWDHKPLGDGVLLAAGIGAITGGVTGGIGKYGGKILARVLRRGAGVAEDAEGAAAATPKVCPLSFSPDTAVATPDGEQAIGTLQVGDHVLAYDPQAGKASSQTVEHVWINHDTDLIDLTLHIASDSVQHVSADANGKQQEAALAAHGLRAPPTDEQTARQAEAARQSEQTSVNGAAHASVARSTAPADETVHTTYKHPWLTADRGWVKAGELRLGERVVRLDGTTAVVTAERVVRGAADYYNLEVSHLHTFAVGTGQYVVHNCNLGQAADARAKSLFSQLPNKAFKEFRTVGVGHFEDENGVQRTLVSIARGKWRGYMKPLLRDTEEWVGGRNHAEINILNAGRQRGWRLLGMGSSIDACLDCGIEIMRAGGPSALGTDIRGYANRRIPTLLAWWKGIGR